ncbi:MAG: TRAP transporter TatT component family protein [Acidobacteriota bacterium]
MSTRRDDHGSGRRRGVPIVVVCLALTLSAALTGCSVRRMAVDSLASTLADEGASVFASDDDPELVGQALPFALKTFEALLQSDPSHRGLLLATCSGYTQYTFGFVEIEAERLKFDDYRQSRRARDRALKLYLRGRDYCLRALDLEAPGAPERLVRAPETALSDLGKDHVPLLYWTAGAWGSAISAGRDRPEVVADLASVRALLGRALELDADWNDGALHDAMVVLESLPEAMGGSLERAREHHQRALELNDGRRAGTHVTWAWQVSVPRQDRAGFEEALDRALAVDVDRLPEERLANTIYQDLARLLQDQADDLFLDLDTFDSEGTPQ